MISEPETLAVSKRWWGEGADLPRKKEEKEEGRQGKPYQ
jgi:hypothetical protein